MSISSVQLSGIVESDRSDQRDASTSSPPRRLRPARQRPRPSNERATRDLFERRLWPLVALLIAAFVAVPVLVLKHPSASGAGAATPPHVSLPGLPTTTIDDHGRPRRRIAARGGRATPLRAARRSCASHAGRAARDDHEPRRHRRRAIDGRKRDLRHADHDDGNIATTVTPTPTATTASPTTTTTAAATTQLDSRAPRHGLERHVRHAMLKSRPSTQSWTIYAVNLRVGTDANAPVRTTSRA